MQISIDPNSSKHPRFPRICPQIPRKLPNQGECTSASQEGIDNARTVLKVHLRRAITSGPPFRGVRASARSRTGADQSGSAGEMGKSQGRNEVKEETDERLLSYRAVGHSASSLCMILSAKITASAMSYAAALFRMSSSIPTNWITCSELNTPSTPFGLKSVNGDSYS